MGPETAPPAPRTTAMQPRLDRLSRRPFQLGSAFACAVACVACLGCKASAAAPPTPTDAPQQSPVAARPAGAINDTASPSGRKDGPVLSQRTYTKPSDGVLREKLTPLEYEVTQRDATEPPFHNTFWDNHAPALYVDVVTGKPLFTPPDKFGSWPGCPTLPNP